MIGCPYSLQAEPVWAYQRFLGGFGTLSSAAYIADRLGSRKPRRSSEEMSYTEGVSPFLEAVSRWSRTCRNRRCAYIPSEQAIRLQRSVQRAVMKYGGAIPCKASRIVTKVIFAVVKMADLDGLSLQESRCMT